MPSDITVDMDQFGSTLNQLLGRVDAAVEDAFPPAVRKGATVARDEWRENAPKRTGGYANSISFRVKGEGYDTQAEVGSATKPGLAHLLEKGHARVGGGRVPARPHIKDAAEDAFDVVAEEFSKNVDKSLGSV